TQPGSSGPQRRATPRAAAARAAARRSASRPPPAPPVPVTVPEHTRRPARERGQSNCRTPQPACPVTLAAHGQNSYCTDPELEINWSKIGHSAARERTSIGYGSDVIDDLSNWV